MRPVVIVLAVLIAVMFVLALVTSADRANAWIHLVGLGLTAVLLGIIALGRVPGFASRPPD
jgi:hypothetical protein